MTMYAPVTRNHVMTGASGDEVVFVGWTAGWQREHGVRVMARLAGRSYEGHLNEPTARQLWLLLKESGFRPTVRLAGSISSVLVQSSPLT